MALGFTVLDNQDGSGATATISGSLGASNVVYYTQFSGGTDVANYTWTIGGSIVGDGTVPLSLGLGYWEYMLVSGAFSPANSIVVYGAVTNAAIQEAHTQLLQGSVQRINQLSLLSSAYVIQQWVPTASDAQIKMMSSNNTQLIICSPNGLDEYAGQVTTQDDIILPVQVSIVFLQNQDSVANLNMMLSWRNRIARALRYQRLVGMTGEAGQQLTCYPKPGLVLDPDAFKQQNLLVSTYYFGYCVRQTRGLT